MKRLSFIALFLASAASALATIGYMNGKAITTSTSIVGGARASVNGTAIAAGGSPAWTYTVASGDTDANRVVVQDGSQWMNITLPAGTASKLGFYIRDYSYTSNIKIALYDGSGTLLQEASPVSVTATGTYEVNITSTSVSAGTHKISWVSDSNSASSLGSKSGVGNLYYTFTGAGNYTNLSPIPASDGSVSETVCVGVYITP